MNELEFIKRTEAYIAFEFKTEGSGHDWYHIDRVRKMALKIGREEKCDLFITEMAALLHDLDDWKLQGSESPVHSRSGKFLAELKVDSAIALKVLQIIDEVSYQGVGTETPVSSVEGAVVQDADRLDAIGAIGIARAFAYGGHKGRLIYDPVVSPVMHADFQEYRKSTGPTINHFYEKLLLLSDRMNTETARKIAKGRHQFIQNYLSQFHEECQAKK